MFIVYLLALYLVYLIGNYRGRRRGLGEGYVRARNIFGDRL